MAKRDKTESCEATISLKQIVFSAGALRIEKRLFPRIKRYLSDSNNTLQPHPTN